MDTAEKMVVWNVPVVEFPARPSGVSLGGDVVGGAEVVLEGRSEVGGGDETCEDD